MSKDYPYAYGVWLSPKDGLPPVYIDEDTEMPTSEAVIIKGKDRCIWLATWNGEVWSNANTSDVIWMEKDYVVKWLRIPK